MMAELQPSDQFLVNRDGVSYNVTQENLMAQIQDDDLMLVNRDNASYKITGAEVKDSFVDPVEIQSVTLSTTTPKVDEDITAIVESTGGKNPVTTYQWQRDGVDIPVVQTYNLRVPSVQGNSQDATYTVQQADIGKKLDCVVTITDDLGSTATKTSPETQPVQANETVDTPTLLTPPNGAGLGPDTITPTTDSLSSVSTTGTTTTVVASGNDDIDVLAEGSALMTDASGTVATYTPTSNTITNVTNAQSSSDNYQLFYTVPAGTTVNNLDHLKEIGTKVPSGTNWDQTVNDVYMELLETGIVGQKIFVDGWLRTSSYPTYGPSDPFYEAKSTGMYFKADGTSITYYLDETWNTNDVKYITYASYTEGMTLSSLTAPQVSGYMKLSKLYTPYTLGVTPQVPSASYVNDSKILTFSDNQDLTYFKVGDEIGSTQTPTEGQTNNFANPQNAFDDDESTFTVNPSASSSQNTYIGFSTSFTPTTFTVKVRNDSGGTPQTFAFNTNNKNTGSKPGKFISVTPSDGATINDDSITINPATTVVATFSVTNPEYATDNTYYLYATNVTGGNLKIYTISASENITILDVNVNNNQMTVSGGDWAPYGGYNTNEEWSDDISGSVTATYTKESAFNGETTGTGWLPTRGTSGVWTANLAASSLTIYCQSENPSYDGSQVTATFDGVTVSVPIPDGLISSASYNIAIPQGATTLDNITVTNGDQTSPYITLQGVVINGLLLVDQSVTPPAITGDNKVIAHAITGTGRVSTVDASTNTITVTESNGNWVSSGAWNTTTKQGNAAGTSFYLTGDEVQTITVDPDDVHMTCTAFSGTGGAVYEETTWQITTDDDTNFLTPVVNVTNTNETFYNVSTITPETDPVDSVSGAGTTGDPYVLTLTGDSNLSYFDPGESVTSIAAGGDGGGAGSAHGLRFDSARENYLQNTKGTITSFTLSTWVKWTAVPNIGYIRSFTSINNTSSNYLNCQVDDTGIASFASSEGGINATDALSANEWHNVVYTYDGTTGKIYVDGDEVASGTKTFSAISSESTSYIGRSNTNTYSNGYLSEVFFVDGQTLEPSVFGSTNSDTQTWVPKSGTAVKAAIGSFGTNGFYLPFNPAATGVNYTNQATVTGTFDSIYPLSTIFDGNLSTGGQPDRDSSVTTVWPAGLISGSIRLYVYNRTTSTIVINDTQTITGDLSGFVDVTESSITKIVQTRDGSAEAQIMGIEVDGALLVDHNNIGVDDSGNGNDFFDQNFAVGNTSAIWSASALIENPGYLPASQGFDGRVINNNNGASCVTDNNNTTTSMTFNDLPIAGTNVKIFISRNQGQSSISSLVIGDVTVDVSGQATGSSAYVLEEYTANVTSGTSIVVTFAQITGASTCYIGGITVDGVFLIDANIQDTVSDTPNTNYAVLEQGVNGNLGTKAAEAVNTVSTVGVTSTAYAEVTINTPYSGALVNLKDSAGNALASYGNGVTFTSGDIIGVAVNNDSAIVNWYVNGTHVSNDSIDTSNGVFIGGYDGGSSDNGVLVYNFGQQPFAAPNVTYNQDTGIVTLAGAGTFETLHEMEASTTVTGTVVSASSTAKTLTLTASDDWSGTTGHTVEGEPGTGLSEDTIYRARVRQTSTNSITSDFSDVNRFKTSGGAPEPASGGGGLRFDSNRVTQMNRTTSSSTTFTYSFWVKLTQLTGSSGSPENILIQGYDDGSSGTGWKLLMQDGAVQFNGQPGLTTYRISSGQVLNENEWAHVVVSCQADASNSFIYVNGTDVTTTQDAGATNVAQALNGIIGGDTLNGYISEFYFVDGQQLLPTVFGESINNGTWVPKDADAVSTAITSAGGFGTNGFYLPFNPAATGANYSANTIYTDNTGIGESATYPVENLYDGNLVTEFVIAASDVEGDEAVTDFTFLPGGGITVSSSLKVALTYSTTTGTVTANGGATTGSIDFSTVGSYQWFDIPNPPALLTTLTFDADATGTGGGGSFVLVGVEVDGALLVDHNNIGVDASGNNNDFHDQNFAVGDTSQVWSSYGTGTPLTATSVWANAFDGQISTTSPTAGLAASSSTMTWTPQIPIPVTSAVTFYVLNETDGSTYGLKANGSYVSSVSNDNYGLPITKTAAELGSSLSSIELVTNDNNKGAYLTGVEVDGVLLIDANIQDTVLDAPLTNYAVIVGRSAPFTSNGNLVLYDSVNEPSSNSTDQTVYFEVTINDLTTANSAQVGYATSDESASITYASDGVITDGSANNTLNVATYTNNDVIGVIGDPTAGKYKFFKNGEMISDNVSGPQGTTIVAYSGAYSSSTVTVNYGQQPFAYATNNMNGTATVDGELCQLLVESITQQTDSGRLYYDIHRGELTTALQVQNRYGILLKDFVGKGIRNLGGALLNRLR